jgi:hypothetical protein
MLRESHEKGMGANLQKPKDCAGKLYFTRHVDVLGGRQRHGMVLWRDKLNTRMAANIREPLRSTR